MVYRYALVEKDKIWFRSPWMPAPPFRSSWMQAPPHWPIQPGLLQVNRQVRGETALIYYKENTFEWEIHGGHSENYLKWVQASEYRALATTRWSLRGDGCFTLVEPWLQAFYNRKAKGPSSSGADPKVKGLKIPFEVYLFDLTRRMRDQQHLTWEQAWSNLKDVRSILVHSRWI